jgi:hypothetical protein
LVLDFWGVQILQFIEVGLIKKAVVGFGSSKSEEPTDSLAEASKRQTRRKKRDDETQE